ncbi:MAG: exodeoxyribonuclease VII small subunit [Faecalibacterium sp.]
MRAPKSFEEGMNRLNTILAQMQSEETSLAESVKLYSEAASLMEYCRAALEKATLQMEEIDARLLGANAGSAAPEEDET